MTEFINEKIGVLTSLIRQFSLEKYQNELLILDAAESTGDAATDAQITGLAQGAAQVVLTCNRRIDVRKQALEELNKELMSAAKA